MAKIIISFKDNEKVIIQSGDFDKVYNCLKENGYSHEEATDIAGWSIGNHSGSTYEIEGAEIKMERGNIETYDTRINNWIPSPPEMESFLADIIAVCKKHRLSLTTDDDGQIIPLLVQKYDEGNISMIDGAKKDYDISEITR